MNAREVIAVALIGVPHSNAVTQADAVLAALAEAGLAVLPVEPTEKMMTLGQRAFARKMYDATSPAPTEHPYDGGGALGYAYRAMLAAASEDRDDA